MTETTTQIDINVLSSRYASIIVDLVTEATALRQALTEAQTIVAELTKRISELEAKDDLD